MARYMIWAATYFMQSASDPSAMSRVRGEPLEGRAWDVSGKTETVGTKELPARTGWFDVECRRCDALLARVRLAHGNPLAPGCGHGILRPCPFAVRLSVRILQNRQKEYRANSLRP